MEMFGLKMALPARVRMFFSVRAGGVSDPPFHSLNLSVNVGDDRGAVYENRMRLAANLPAEPMWLRQAHGARAVCADDVARDADVADASFTRTPGVVCAVQTADCLPVLLFDEEGTVVAAAHAGWRGLVAGVLENALAAMRGWRGEGEVGPVYACVGPAIGAAHYVVGSEVRDALVRGEGDEGFFVPCDEEDAKWRADLVGLAVRRLTDAGVRAVHVAEGCTFSDSARLFSVRRDGARTGRQAAGIFIGE